MKIHVFVNGCGSMYAIIQSNKVDVAFTKKKASEKPQ